MKAALLYLLGVGIVWTLLAIWLFLSIGGVAGDIESFGYTALYWAGMSVGPVALIFGTVLLLAGRHSTLSEALIIVGCTALTVFALYNSVVGMRRDPLQAPPMYSFYVILLAVMFVADFAGFTVVKQARSARTR